jgi:hypothetical protein
VEIIDAHVHLFPTRDAGQKALRNVSPTGYWGTWDELTNVMHKANVSRAAAVATLPLKFMFEAALMRQGKTDEDVSNQELMERMLGRLHRYNTWLREQCRSNGNLWAFIYADPFVGMERLLEEISSQCGRGGVRGLKMHPMLGHYFPDDPSLWPLYEFASSQGLIIIFHGGRSPESPKIQYAHPKRFRKVLKAFPGLEIVVAHMGMDFWQDTKEIARSFENVHFDTSVAISDSPQRQALSDPEAVRLIRAVGTGKVMFASDFPWGDPSRDIQRVLKLGLSDSELEEIVAGNAMRVFARG